MPMYKVYVCDKCNHESKRVRSGWHAVTDEYHFEWDLCPSCWQLLLQFMNVEG
jgi:hypothetical protein